MMTNDNSADDFEALQRAHQVASTEVDTLLDRAHSADNDEERLALLRVALEKMARVNQRLIDFAVQNGLWKIRPFTREQEKRIYLAMLWALTVGEKLTTDEKCSAIVTAKGLKENVTLPLRYGSSRFLRAVADYRDMLDTLEQDKGHHGFSYTRLHILMAYFETASWRNTQTLPTRGEVQKREQELFGFANSTEAIRQTLNDLGIPWRREDRTGRPPGRKDSPNSDRQRKKLQRKNSNDF